MSLLTAAAAMTWGGSVAQAVELDDVVTAITVTPNDPRQFDPIRIDIEFCVPPEADAGDEFRVILPDQLVDAPRSVTIFDPDGAVVANGVVSGSDPEVATFTFTSYVDERDDVCGNAFFESRLDDDVAENSTQRLVFEVSGGATFETEIEVGERRSVAGRGTARKGGYFGDPADECRTQLDGCLGWYIETRPGPFAAVEIVDVGLTDAVFECDRLSVRLWSLNGDGSLDGTVSPGSVGATVTSSCAADSLDIVVTDVPADVIVRVLVRATPEFADETGGIEFVNVASVTQVLADETTVVDEVVARRRSSEAGGEAVGVIPPTTTTTTTTTTTLPVVTTTTTPTDSTSTTTVDTSTTVANSTTSSTIVEINPPTSSTTTEPLAPVLPATGSETPIGIASLLVAAGGLALVASRRPRSDAEPV